MNPCKRYDVFAIGITPDGEVFHARNGNESECKNVPGACGCIHAEENLLKGNKNITTVFLSHSPCLECARRLYYANVQTVIYLNEYRIREGIDYLKRCRVNIVQFTPDMVWKPYNTVKYLEEDGAFHERKENS